MKRTKISLIILGTVAAVGLMAPAFPAASQESPGQKQEKADKAQQPFHGKVDSVDTSAKTLTVDGKLIYIADTTKLTKAGKAIMLSDVQSGDQVNGTTRQTFDGKTEAITVKVGPPEKEKN
jgi:hypothetical protein